MEHFCVPAASPFLLHRAHGIFWCWPRQGAQHTAPCHGLPSSLAGGHSETTVPKMTQPVRPCFREKEKEEPLRRKVWFCFLEYFYFTAPCLPTLQPIPDASVLGSPLIITDPCH